MIVWYIQFLKIISSARTHRLFDSQYQVKHKNSWICSLFFESSTQLVFFSFIRTSKKTSKLQGYSYLLVWFIIFWLLISSFFILSHNIKRTLFPLTLPNEFRYIVSSYQVQFLISFFLIDSSSLTFIFFPIISPLPESFDGIHHFIWPIYFVIHHLTSIHYYHHLISWRLANHSYKLWFEFDSEYLYTF